jgi:hypothetical protein
MSLELLITAGLASEGMIVEQFEPLIQPIQIVQETLIYDEAETVLIVEDG